MATEWNEFKKTLNISDENKALIAIEESLIESVIRGRERSESAQKQLPELFGIKQPVIAKFERGYTTESVY